MKFWSGRVAADPEARSARAIVDATSSGRVQAEAG
jgi:hypothetical protein